MRTGLVCALVLVLVTACGESREDELTDLADAGLITTTTIDRTTIGDLPDVTQPIAELTQQLGAPLLVRTATVSYDQFSLQVRSKDNPDDVDAYSYLFEERSWSKPVPIKLSAKDVRELDSRVFDASEVAWAALPRLGPEAIASFQELEQPGVPGARVSRSIRRDGSEVFRITIDVTGLRGSAQVVADARTGAVIDQQRV